MRKFQSSLSLDMRRLVCAAAIFAMASMAGCSPSELKWDEDVLLPDGRTVTVHRVQQWFKGEEGQAGDYSLEFVDPDTKEVVRWAHDRHLTTMVLFKHRGDTYLLLKTLWGSSDSIYRCPNPPYFLRKYRAGGWVEVPLSAIPMKKLKVNMTDSVFDRYELIKQSDLKLGTTVTQSRTVRTSKPPHVAPYEMDFSNVQQQTFGMQNCGFGKADLLYSDQVR